ncbi:MAG: hypothetical protein NVSMB32_16730 [Actinomycetota bacterium]
MSLRDLVPVHLDNVEIHPNVAMLATYGGLKSRPGSEATSAAVSPRGACSVRATRPSPVVVDGVPAHRLARR